MRSDEVSLTLTRDEALVLFEFVSRFSDTDKLSIVDQAEERALWNLTCVLEKVLSEPFGADYEEVIRRARAAKGFGGLNAYPRVQQYSKFR